MRSEIPQRTRTAFSGYNPNDLLSQKVWVLRTNSTATKSPCSGFAPNSLVQQTDVCHKVSRDMYTA